MQLSGQFTDKVERILLKIYAATYAIDTTLKILAMVHEEAARESGFRESENTPSTDPEAVKDILELIADVTTSAAQDCLDQLVEARLSLGTAISELKAISASGDQT